jgi:DNA replication protein DnaC
MLPKGAGAIFIGNPGVGKTFLAKIIGWRACQAKLATGTLLVQFEI